MILDKLIEKKDLLLYIEMRKKILQKRYKENLTNLNPTQRHDVFNKMKAKIKELDELKRRTNNIKDMNKKYWSEVGD